MDMQGTPIGSTNQGMKNTTDPASNETISEGAGAVASDSLAAESATSGGAFNANRDSNPLSVKGGNSTLANTDISNAATLAPAPDAAEREAKAAWQEASDDTKGPAGMKYPEGSGGQPEFPGKINADGYSGGSTAAKDELAKKTQSKSTAESDSTGASSGAKESSGSTDTSNGSTGLESDSTVPPSSSDNKAQSNVDAAPGYVTDVYAHDKKPKGKNLTEGGFDSNPENNASFNSDIGSENDPSRAAELSFQNRQAATVGTGPKQSGVSGDGQYDVLETEQSL